LTSSNLHTNLAHTPELVASDRLKVCLRQTFNPSWFRRPGSRRDRIRWQALDTAYPVASADERGGRVTEDDRQGPVRVAVLVLLARRWRRGTRRG